MKVALINTNRIKPPIAPIALDYLAEALSCSGHSAMVLDLCWEEQWHRAIEEFLNREKPGLVGLSLRNTDDCAYASGSSFLGEFSEMVDAIRRSTDAMIVAGGVGFSVMPEQVLALCRADAGIWGEGEFALPKIADALEAKASWQKLPGVVWQCDGKWKRNPPKELSLADLPSMGRRWIDNERYFEEGGQAGIETKRGCNQKCIYCADPLAKGRSIRVRPASAVADELRNLLAQGIDHIHTCDSEFNLPIRHAEDVCAEIIRRGLGDRLQWYAYCSPKPFTPELASLMRKAGCVGINFGADSGDNEMLRKLKRGYGAEDIAETVRACQEQDITVMLDLLIGGPGENERSIRNTIELVKGIEADRVGVAVGVRVYPGTGLAQLLAEQYTGFRQITDQELAKPVFFIEPEIAEKVYTTLDRLIAGDERFLFFNPSDPGKNYNYNANQVLVDAIAQGYRGAYWDILRKFAG